MRYLGLDLGSKTLGLSISDKTGFLASQYSTLRYTDIEVLIKDLLAIMEKEKIEALVLGYPINLNGTLSDRCRITDEFKVKLEQFTDKKIFLQDERLTTVEAKRLLIENNTSRSKRKKVIDKIAAVLILQAFLDKQGRLS
jgi:putative Holliday junction resolvase